MKLKQLFQWQRMCLLLAGLAVFWMACAGEPPNALGLACAGDDMCWGDGVICINEYCRIDAVDSQCPSTCKSSADCRGYTACSGKEKCDKGQCVALDPGTCPTFCEKNSDCHTCDNTETFICNFRNECDEAKKSCETASCQDELDCAPYQDCGTNPTCDLNTGKCVKGTTGPTGCGNTCKPTERCNNGICEPKGTTILLRCTSGGNNTCPLTSVCGKQGSPSEDTCTKACFTGPDACKLFNIPGITNLRCVPDLPKAGVTPPDGTEGSCLVECSNTDDPCGRFDLTCCKPAAKPKGTCQAKCKIP